MSFDEFNFHPEIDDGIAACGYTMPTPIQKETIPLILEGKDLIGLAQTGTGKTAAFVLPILQHLVNNPGNKPRVLIMAPTRELAEQIHDNIIKLSPKTSLKSITIYGGVKKSSQIKGIRAGAQIIVSCPGRLLDLINDRVIILHNIDMLILDEADHMFDKGFLPDIKRIIKLLPKKRQTLVFSATMPREIKLLAEKNLQNPAMVRVNHSLPAPTISHTLFFVKKEQRTQLLKYLIQEKEMDRTLVFTRTKHKAKSLALALKKAGYHATSLQGNLTQNKRQKALSGFREGVFKILVATDIAARGIDVRQISHVINYDLPDTIETYTHRAGRTGRAGEAGQAFTFADQTDRRMISLIEKNMKKRMKRQTLPSFEPNKQELKTNRPQTIVDGNDIRPCLWSESLTLA